MTLIFVPLRFRTDSASETIVLTPNGRFDGYESMKNGHFGRRNCRFGIRNQCFSYFRTHQRRAKSLDSLHLRTGVMPWRAKRSHFRICCMAVSILFCCIDLPQANFFESFSNFFRKIFGFGWAALPPRPPEFGLGGQSPGGQNLPSPPPLTGLAGGLLPHGLPAFFLTL